MRSALLAADLVLIPVQPSPLDGWASAEMLALLNEARIYRPELAPASCSTAAARAPSSPARRPRRWPITIRRCSPHTIGQRVVFADAAQSGRLVFEIDDDSPAAREIAALCRRDRTAGHREGRA
jgi:chromosome partitioning protein